MTMQFLAHESTGRAPEKALDSLLLFVGKQMSVATNHFICLVTDPFVDHSLFYTRSSAIATE